MFGSLMIITGPLISLFSRVLGMRFPQFVPLPITEGYNTLVDMFLNEDKIYQLLDENQEGI